LCTGNKYKLVGRNLTSWLVGTGLTLGSISSNQEVSKKVVSKKVVSKKVVSKKVVSKKVVSKKVVSKKVVRWVISKMGK